MVIQSSPKPRRPLWVAAFIGLSGGLLLSVPLSRLSGDQSVASMPLPLGNPFGSWAGFGPKEVVVLGRDASGFARIPAGCDQASEGYREARCATRSCDS